MANEIHLELLLGKPVLDSTGKAIGSIEEVRASKQGEEWIVQEYLIGYAAVLERLSAWTVGLGILHLLGAHKIHGGYTIPWDKLDLTDPNKPRLRCSLDELKQFATQLLLPACQFHPMLVQPLS
jgi:sporulation protein YlmC with PRC-barrel domain